MGRSYITKINVGKNETKIKHEEIAEEFANYYQLLYRKEEGEIKQIQMYLNNVKLPKITPEQK
uniref:Uncharacterized protein n=1 Tax=Neogobius melanostomus TaxID=47308 RepID=A0A8C6S6R1_9GOBI